MEQNKLFDDKWFFLILGFMLLIIAFFGVYSLISGKPLTQIQVILEFFKYGSALMLGFRWGSSLSSQKKDDKIAGSIPIDQIQTLQSPNAEAPKTGPATI